MKNPRWIVCLLLAFLFSPLLFSQTHPTDENNVTLPWSDFRQLLSLDDQHIVISTQSFEKLLTLTGTEIRPERTLKNGQVILTKQAFDSLITQLKTPDPAFQNPPFDYLLTKAIYSGNLQDNTARFQSSFTIHVLKKDAFIKIPILPQNTAVSDVMINGKEAWLIAERGYQQVLINKPGVYQVQADFAVKIDLDRGPHKLDLQILNTPVTLFNLSLPFTQIDVDIPQAQQISTHMKDKTTEIEAVISSGSSISVRWRKKMEVTEKIPAKVYSEFFHLISIEDDALKINTQLQLNILHSEIDGLQLSIPEGTNILSVSGEGVGEWQELSVKNDRILQIPFAYGKKGSVTLSIQSENGLTEEGTMTQFSGVRVIDAVRETGSIGVELNTSAEVIIEEQSGLEKIPVQKLSPAIMNRSVKPILFGFKYIKHPYLLSLHIEKHLKIAVPTATIQSASAVTLFTEDGKIVQRLVYQIRNNAKQFLEISLPDSADVWSVFVGNDPVESSLNRSGKLLVPLIRSSSYDNQLNTFPVEVIYCLVQDRFKSIKTLKTTLPAVDLITSQIMWSVYLPNDYTYWRFQSTLEKEEIIRGINIFAGKREYNDKIASEIYKQNQAEPSASISEDLKKVYKGKEYKSRFRNVPMEESQLREQMDNEIGFSQRMDEIAQQAMPQSVTGSGVSTGVLPVQIKVPTSGQVYRFAKTIIKPEDPLEVSVFYMSNWIPKMIRWIVVIILLFLIYLERKWLTRLFKLFGAICGILNLWIKKHQKTLQAMLKSWSMIIVILVLAILTASFSLQLSFLLILCGGVLLITKLRKTPVSQKKPIRRRKS